MERVQVDEHPLSLSEENLFPSRSSDSEPGQPRRQQARSPAAFLLVQSAVRSVLDDATPTPSTIISGDGSESGSCADRTLGKRSPTSSPTLRSLQIETLPAIPDEQDRRRFIGCLAAILASAYDYDEPDDATASGEQGCGAFSYLDFTEEHYDDEEEEPFSRDNLSASRSFESLERQDSSETSVWSEVNTSRDKSSSPSKKSPQRSLSKRRSQNTWRTSSKERARLSMQRYRRRRYDALCKLLISSSELLLLDKSVAKAFLPMLERVLMPQAKSSRGKPSSEKPKPPLNGRRATNQSSSGSPGGKIGASLRTSISSFGGASGIVPDGGGASYAGDSGFDYPGTQREYEYIPKEVDQDDVLGPFLESLTPGAGFRCLSLLLLQYLLTSEVGYDARIRHVLKKLGVIVLVHDMKSDPVERELSPSNGRRDSTTYKDMVTHATRKFESLEHSIARRLIRLSESKNDRKSNSVHGIANTGRNKRAGITQEKILRGVKIGSAGIVAGTLFALTGGLAAPGIAAGIAAVAGSAAATAAVVALTSTVVVTTIFGVGGGGLAAYKMQRRTQGLTEFEFRKETNSHSRNKAGNVDGSKSDIEAELFSTICISGWLRDNHDFQRPWGLYPTSPRLNDRVEVLERFYYIHSPDHIPKCAKILSSWKGEEKRLWSILREKYGRDPDHLFPLDDGQRFRGALTLEQDEVLDQIFVELGYNSAAPNKQKPSEKPSTPFERMREGWKGRHMQKPMGHDLRSAPDAYRGFDSTHGPYKEKDHNRTSEESASHISTLEPTRSEAESSQEEEFKPPAHLATVWDYRTTYGGELYTVRWESHLLKTICDCVMDLAMDVVSGATRQILKQTILSTLFAAVLWPSYLLNVANMIDGDWTLAVERADEAGRELAKTLLFSRAGRRPVTLIGFSFGGRVIYSCLKEMARLQEEWEEYQELKRDQGYGSVADEHHLAKLQKKFEGMREPSSVVEDAIIMGLPNHLSLLSWKACRQVVAGRLVNCYSTKDLILSLMFQAKRFSPGVESILKPVCGTCPVHEPGVENIDVSDLISGHQDYCLVTGKILERVRHGQPLRCNSLAADGVNGEPEPAKKLQF